MNKKLAISLTLATGLAGAVSAMAEPCPKTTHRFYAAVDGGWVKTNPNKKFNPSVSLFEDHKHIKSWGGAMRFGFMDNIGYLFYAAEGSVGWDNGTKSYKGTVSQTASVPLSVSGVGTGTTTFTGTGNETLRFKSGYNMDLIAKLGMRINRAYTYILGGGSWAYYKTRDIATLAGTATPVTIGVTSYTLTQTGTGVGKGSKKDMMFGSVIGGGVMYDFTHRFAMRFEYRHSQYHRATATAKVAISGTVTGGAPGLTGSATVPVSVRVKPTNDLAYIGFVYRI